ncbi:MAG: ligand-gated channel [Melioribacteraceae bacterium]|nr:MAG: ligand-gated channel [Melioribacteraceae bacterium]
MMNSLNRWGRFIFSFLVIFALSTNAQDDKYCGVTGVILNGETNEPVSEVNISLVDLDLSTSTDSTGNFHFHNVIEGTHRVEITHVAYLTNNTTITLNPESKKYVVFYLLPGTIEIAPVVVTDIHTHSRFEQHGEIKSVLKGKKLEREMGLTLANTLKNETGIAVRSMGPAPARPILRGLGGDRVLISEDNNKTADLSATSPDHAVTVEPFSVEKIEVLRGPKVLIHSSTTIGGVVNVIRHDIPVNTFSGISGYAGFYGETANNGKLGSIGIKAPVAGINISGELSRKYASDVTTPTGKLGNSFSSTTSGALGASYVGEDWFSGLSYREYKLGYGVPGGFVGAHPGGVDIYMLRRTINAKGRFNYGTSGKEYMEYNLSRVYYEHEELEKNLSIGSKFRITHYIGNLNYYHISYFGWDKGISGISAEYRDFKIGGRVFTPPTNSVKFTTYFYEQLSGENLNIDFAFRYEYSGVRPDASYPDSKIGNIRNRDFHALSLSLSGIYELSDIVSLGANISRSSRVPTIEELFSGGPHLAAYSFEVGNPELNTETGFGSEIFIFHRFSNLYYNLTFFGNRLNNYIIPRNTGELNYQLFLPIYAYSGINAGFYGVEYQFEWNPVSYIKLSNSGAYTYGEFTDSGAPLPQIPPFKGIFEISLNYDQTSITTDVEYTTAQKRVDEFEEPTAGYAVWNASVQHSLVGGNLVHNFSLNIDNILNKEYRNHLSRVKSILPEAGRNIRLTYKLYFN